MIAFLCILLFFVFLFSLKATVTVIYDGEVALLVRVLFIKIKILPSKEKKRPRSMSAKKAAKLEAKLLAKEKKKRAKKAQKKKEKAEKKEAVKRGETKKKKMSPDEILDIIHLVTALLKKIVGNFWKHLRIKVARIRINIGTGDAATTAIVYGAATQAINAIFPLLDRTKQVKVPKSREVYVNADFTAEETEMDIKISFSLRVWHLFHVLFSAIPPLFGFLFKKIKRKAESEQ